MNRIKKLIFIGDTSVGKTCFLITYTSNTFPEEYIPTVFDNFQEKIILDGNPVNIGFWDTSSSEESDKLRPLCYENTDCFVIFFSVVNPETLESIRSKWIPEIKRYCGDTPFIIVGTKVDLQNDVEMMEKLSHKGIKPISYETGSNFAKEVGAYAYVETSAKIRIGLIEAVTKAAEASILNQKLNIKTKKDCILF